MGSGGFTPPILKLDNRKTVGSSSGLLTPGKKKSSIICTGSLVGLTASLKVMKKNTPDPTRN
jgi:hypothetical protein